MNFNGTRGHYITKDIEIHQGHSNNNFTRPGNWWLPTRNKTQEISSNIPNNSRIFNRAEPGYIQPNSTPTWLPPKHEFTWKKPDTNVPTVSIEENYTPEIHQQTEQTPDKPPSEIDTNKFDVDVLDIGNSWKPKLVFENKTKNNNDSVTMKIDTKTTDLDIFNVEFAPWREGKFLFLNFFYF